MFNTSNSSNGNISSSSSSNINNAPMHHSSSVSNLNASSNTTNRLHDEMNASDSNAMYLAPASASTPIQFGQQSTASFYQNTQAIEIYPRNSNNNYYAPVKPFNYYQTGTNADQMSFGHENQMQSAFNSNENFYNYKAYRDDIDEEEEVDNDDENENETNMGDEGTDEVDEHHLMVSSDNPNNHYQQYVHQNQNEIFNEYEMGHSVRFNPMQAQKMVPNVGGNDSEFYQNSLLMPNYNYCNNQAAYTTNGSSATTSSENVSHLPQSQTQLDEANAFSLYNIQSSANQTPIVTQHHQNNNLLDPNGQFNTNNASHFDYSALSLNDVKTDIRNNKKLPDWSLNSYKSKSMKSSLTSRTKILCQVCGDKSSGFHFGVYTCEACKGFFRRCNKKYKANTGPCAKRCVITKETRNNCSRCRFERCISVGMAVEKIRFGKTPKHVAANLILSATTPLPVASTTSTTPTITSKSQTSAPNAQYQSYSTSQSNYDMVSYEQQTRIDKLIKTLLSYFEAAKHDLNLHQAYATPYFAHNTPSRLIYTQDMLVRLKEKIIIRLCEYVNESTSNPTSRSYEIPINQLTPPSSSCSSSSSSSSASSASCSSASSCNTSTCSSSCPPSSSSACSSSSNSSIKPLTPQSNGASYQSYAIPFMCQLRLSLSNECLFAAFVFLVIDEASGIKMESNELFGEVSAVCNKSLLNKLSGLFESVYQSAVHDLMGDDSNNRTVKTLHFILILLMQNLCSINSGSSVTNGSGKSVLDGDNTFRLQRVITMLIALKCRNRKTKHRILLTLDNFLQF